MIVYCLELFKKNMDLKPDIIASWHAWRWL